MALFSLTMSSSARACSGSEMHSTADASSVARNLVIGNRSHLNPGIGSPMAWDIADPGEDCHISSGWRRGPGMLVAPILMSPEGPWSSEKARVIGRHRDDATDTSVVPLDS